MTFFKLTGVNLSSKKNKTTSAASTPAQTPRTSFQLNAEDIGTVHKNMAMSHNAALESVFQMGS
ncbi:hypothetical protein BGZ65_008771, partial [Modicella reniformis]